MKYNSIEIHDNPIITSHEQVKLDGVIVTDGFTRIFNSNGWRLIECSDDQIRHHLFKLDREDANFQQYEVVVGGKPVAHAQKYKVTVGDKLAGHWYIFFCGLTIEPCPVLR